MKTSSLIGLFARGSSARVHSQPSPLSQAIDSSGDHASLSFQRDLTTSLKCFDHRLAAQPGPADTLISTRSHLQLELRDCEPFNSETAILKSKPKYHTRMLDLEVRGDVTQLRK